MTKTTKTSETIIDDSYIENLLSDMLSDNNDVFYLSELTDINNHILDGSFKTDYVRLAFLHSYQSSISAKNRFINDVYEKYITAIPVNQNLNRKIVRSIENIFELIVSARFNKIYYEIIEIKLFSSSHADALNKIFHHVYSILNDYHKHLKSTINANRDQLIYYSYKYLPLNIRSEIDDYIIENNTAIKQLVATIDTTKNRPGVAEKNVNKMLSECVYRHQNDIVNMHLQNVSLNQIQSRLTKMCIENNEIPPTVCRPNRSRGSTNESIEMPTLLPLSSIKAVIDRAYPIISLCD